MSARRKIKPEGMRMGEPACSRVLTEEVGDRLKDSDCGSRRGVVACLMDMGEAEVAGARSGER